MYLSFFVFHGIICLDFWSFMTLHIFPINYSVFYSFKGYILEMEERKIILLQELRTDKNPHCSKKCISSFQHNENGAVRKHLY